MGLIDKEKLMQSMYHLAFETEKDTMWMSGCWVRYRAIEDVIKSQPAQPDRKKGKWIYCEDMCGVDGYCCDKCGFHVPWDYTHKFIDFIKEYHYCPNCGAKMREGKT